MPKKALRYRCSPANVGEHLTLVMAPASSKEFLDIHANYRVWFTMKLVHDMIITYKLILQSSNKLMKNLGGHY